MIQDSGTGRACQRDIIEKGIEEWDNALPKKCNAQRVSVVSSFFGNCQSTLGSSVFKVCGRFSDQEDMWFTARSVRAAVW